VVKMVLELDSYPWPVGTLVAPTQPGPRQKNEPDDFGGVSRGS
jgi:hypothetical protein